jgi:hypothetical protein
MEAYLERATKCAEACRGLNPEAVPELVGMVEKLTAELDRLYTASNECHAYTDGMLHNARELLARVKG